MSATRYERVNNDSDIELYVPVPAQPSSSGLQVAQPVVQQPALQQPFQAFQVPQQAFQVPQQAFQAPQPPQASLYYGEIPDQHQSGHPQPLPPMAQVVQFVPPQQPGRFARVVLPNPTPAELEQRITLRQTEFHCCKYLSQGWNFVKHNFCTFVLIMLTWFVIGIVYVLISNVITNGLFPRRDMCADMENEGHRTCPEKKSPGAEMFTFFLYFLVSVLVSYPLIWSSYFAVFEAMRGNTHVKYRHFFRGFSKPHYRRAIGISFVLVLFQSLLDFLILPGIWFSFASIFVLPLHQEHSFLTKRLSVNYSIKVVHRHLCSMLGFVLLLVVLQVLGILVFFVGLFVTIPLAHVSVCYAYHNLVGVNGVATYVLPPMQNVQVDGQPQQPQPQPQPQQAQPQQQPQAQPQQPIAI